MPLQKNARLWAGLVRMLALLPLFVIASVRAQSYLPESGSDAIYQRSLDLSSHLNVLMVSLQPGFEDLGTIAYFRFGRGAKVMSAYVTNGEGGESDLRSSYPHELAATRRREASSALSRLDTDSYFMNLPDLPAARDSVRIRSVWPSDSVQWHLVRLIAELKPDIILFCRDWQASGESLRWNILSHDLIEAVKKADPDKSPGDPLRFAPYPRWRASRLFVDDGRSQGVIPPHDTEHPRLRKSYKKIADEAGAAYSSLAYQRWDWIRRATISYRQVHPATGREPVKIDQDLPQPVSKLLQETERIVRALNIRALGRPRGSGYAETEKKGLLVQVAGAMDSVDLHLSRSHDLNARDRKALLHWKTGLENLRNALLNVKVHYRLSDSILTNLQLTYLTIDSISGVKPGGKTELLFPAVDQGWAVNESAERRYPLEYGSTIRLLSPKNLEYNYPPSINGLSHTTEGKPFFFFVIHRGNSKEASFVSRIAMNLFFAPRFSVEVLTPIVRAVEGERLAVRLTNHSRDGVRDTIRVNDSLVVSTPGLFRLNEKGASHLDTLTLHWNRVPESGTRLFPLVIADEPVARFAARSFDAYIDSSKRIGIVQGVPQSRTVETLRRLGATWIDVPPDGRMESILPTLDVLIIDHRALTLRNSLRETKSMLDRFVNEGGHLIVLDQDASAWNDFGLWSGLQLTPTDRMDEETAVSVDEKHPFLSKPNVLAAEDWADWIFRRARNRLVMSALGEGSIPVKGKEEETPLVVSERRGKGTITFVGLALHHQFSNIHPGSFRLLANLVSY